MTFKEMQDEVFIILKDTSLQSRIPAILNDAYQEVVDEVHIPALKTLTTVSTVVGQSFCNLPTGMIGSLLYAGTLTSKLSVANGGLLELLSLDPGLTTLGEVWKVAQEGAVLWYISQPETATSIYVLVYKAPVALVQDGDVPSVLPAMLHRHLLVYQAAAILYNEIEEGVDGEKVNTKTYHELYQSGLNRLREWLAKQVKHNSQSIWSE